MAVYIVGLFKQVELIHNYNRTSKFLPYLRNYNYKYSLKLVKKQYLAYTIANS